MKKRINILTLFAMVGILGASLNIASAANGSSDLRIAHKPIAWGVKGQPLTLKARVSGGVGGVKSVTLYYALFRDAAPFKVKMASSGIGLYVGTIEAGLLSGVNTLSYYIEAEDKGGTIEETPWYDVTFKDADPSQQARRKITPTGTAAASSSEDDSSMTVGLIAGGAAALVVGAYVISDGGSSSSGSGDDNADAREKSGTYNGTATTCITVPPADTTCSNTTISIFIDQNGKVFSDNLLPGQQLVGDLTGNSFSLSGDTSDPAENFSGTIIFSGTLSANSTIVGTINGSITDDGVPGFYSGDFNASK